MAWWLKNRTEEKVEWLTGNLISQDCTTQDCSKGNRSIQQLESLFASGASLNPSSIMHKWIWKRFKDLKHKVTKDTERMEEVSTALCSL